MNNDIRKRRAQPFEDSPSEPELQVLSYTSYNDFPQLTPQDLWNIHIRVPLPSLLPHANLRQYATSQLHCSESHLLSLGDPSGWQQNPHKRRRTSTNLLMAPNSGNLISPGDDEKPPPSRDGFLGGWTAQRLAQCFTGLCHASEPAPSYQPLPQTAAYEYGPSMASVPGPSMASISPQERALAVSTPLTPNRASVFACDDPAIMAQYSYPPLQPTRVVGMQPPTTREEMVYPGPPPVVGDGPYTALDSLTSPVVAAQYGAQGGFRDMTSLGDPYSYGFDSSGGPDGLSYDMYPGHRSVPARRGAFKDQELRAKTALTRKMGSCVRCKMQRIRCILDPENETGPCIPCRRVNFNTRIYRLECLRLKLTDCKLYKPGQVPGHEWTSRWKDSVLDDISVWASGEQITIRVTEGYTDMFVELQVREFVPQPGDKLERTWVDKNGVLQRRAIPPFAIVDLEDAKNSYSHYIKRGLENCCMRLLGPRDQLLHKTYFFAINRARDDHDPFMLPAERSLLRLTLELWMTARLTTKTLEIIGSERLGMPRDLIDDPTNDMHHKTPIPPVLGAQIDSFLIHQILVRLRRKTLEELQKMTQEKKAKTWLTTYLVTFILLHNLGLVTRHDAAYARKHGMRRHWAREDSVKEYEIGANTLLAYFHYCNKGIYPFSAECRDADLRSLAELGDDAIELVHYTRQYVMQQKAQWEDLWKGEGDWKDMGLKRYENEYYYVSQLFEQNWQPRNMP